MTNFFLLYRPFHFEYSTEIIQALFKDDTNIQVNHYDAFYETSSDYFKTRVINLPRKLFDRGIEIRKIKNQIEKLLDNKEQVNVFMPHTLGILANYVYYQLAGKRSNLNLNVFYEGVIVFYNYEHSYLQNLGHYASRWLTSSFMGIPYHPDKKLLNFADNRINKIYTPFLNIDAPADKLVEVKLKKTWFIPRPDTAVLLGLKLEDKHNDEVIRIIRAIYQKLDSLNVKHILFKDHPSEKCELYYKIAIEMGKTLEVIEDTAPVEKIIAGYSPKYVVSIWSSAMINLSTILPDSATIYCFVTERITDSPELKKLVSIFKEQHIEVIYV